MLAVILPNLRLSFNRDEMFHQAPHTLTRGSNSFLLLLLFLLFLHLLPAIPVIFISIIVVRDQIGVRLSVTWFKTSQVIFVTKHVA